MIDRERFAVWMAVIADRFGREMKPPTLRVFYELLSAELDTDSFTRGCARVLKRAAFFPSPQEIIDAASPREDSSVAALREFRAIEEGTYPHGDPVAQEAMKLCGLWDTLRELPTSARVSKEQQFVRLYGTLAARRDHEDELVAIESGTVRNALLLRAGSVPAEADPQAECDPATRSTS